MEAPPRRGFYFGNPALLDWGAGALVLATYALVQLALLQGPQPYDSAKYFKTAIAFPDVPADLWTLRIGLVAPVRAAVLAFGPSEAALYAIPIAAGLALAAGVYATAFVLFGDRVVAAAAALVTALNPNYLQRSSAIFPDLAATATFTAGFFCLVLGAAKARKGDTGRAPAICALCAGVLFGWTYLIREFSVILLPTVVIALVLLRFPLRRIAIVAGAAVVTTGLELVYGALRYGDPFVHVRLLLNRGEKHLPPRKGAVIEHIQGQLGSPLDTLVVFPRLLLAWSVGWVFLLLLAVFIAALAARRRDRRVWLLAGWCFSFWVIMAVLGLGSLASGRWILNVTNIRYWSPIFPPLVMGAFGGLALLVPKRGLIRGLSLVSAAAMSIAALALLPGLAEFRSCASRDAWMNDPAGRWHDLRSWFARPDAQSFDVLWTDGYTQRLVPAYTSTTFGHLLWSGKINGFDKRDGLVAPTTDLDHALVLVHKDRKALSHPRLVQSLHAEWSPIFTSRDGNMVLLAYTPTQANDAAGGGQWWLPSPARRHAIAVGTCGKPYVRALIG